MAIAEGMLAQHMAAHIAAMNVAAPCIALSFPRLTACLAGGGGAAMAAATVVQTLLLWTWHVPGMLGTALADVPLMIFMHLSLFMAALWFWAAVAAAIRRSDWQPIAALLVTGKLFCLLGVLLTFAPRALYWQLALIQSCFGSYPAPLADQQLAGLMMLAACPVVFVGAAIVGASRWFRRVEAAPGWRPRPGPA